MPLHDWTKVNPGLFHHFHQFWTTEICRALNRNGVMPAHLAALVEQRSGPKEPDVVAVELDEPDEPWSSSGGGIALLERPKTRIVRQSDNDYYVGKANRVVIRHRLGKIVAFIEIVSPGNKDGAASLRQFVEKVSQSLRQGVHVLVIDPFPPTARDPFGIHKAIWDEIEVEDFELPVEQNRILASYEGDKVFSAFVETVGLGDTLPDMPLFIAAGAHVMVPLEGTYEAAWEATPGAVRRLVVARPHVGNSKEIQPIDSETNMVQRIVWDHIRNLSGRTVLTLGRKRPFEISSIDEDSLQVLPLESKGQKRLSVRRADIEMIAGMAWQKEELRERTAEALPECGVTSYIAAIVHEVRSLAD